MTNLEEYLKMKETNKKQEEKSYEIKKADEKGF